MQGSYNNLRIIQIKLKLPYLTGNIFANSGYALQILKLLVK